MKLKKLVMALVALGIFVGVGAGVKDVRAEVYTYPITPDDPEWANYNHAELVDMLQIPEDILDEMTDEELVESVLNYPYLGDMKFYDDYKVGVQIVRDTFNGLQKLLENENAIDLLLNYYETSIYTNENTSEDIFESVKKDSTEMILSFMMKENVMSEDKENRFAALMTEETGDNSKAALDIGIEPLAEIPFTWKYDVKTPRGSVVKTKLYSYSAVNNSEEMLE